jgi:hypothetical protein
VGFSELMRNYWVVSPNVRNNAATVSAWRQASVLARAAFMGWKPSDHEIGTRFVERIVPGDVILIARRHRFEPEIVGLGVAKGKAKRQIKNVSTPESFGTARRLSPFIPVSRAPEGVPLIEVLQHTSALARLHPKSRDAHARVCSWMEQLLSSNNENPSNIARVSDSGPGHNPTEAQLVDSPKHHQLDYVIQSRVQTKRAKKDEARLLMAYRRWLRRQGRILVAAKYGKLQCDAFERARCNLIEAKSSTSREHIRMAVGQLLDYAFQIEGKLGKPHMAVLLPREPEQNLVNWLPQLNISLVWRKNRAFLDNANGQFM